MSLARARFPAAAIVGVLAPALGGSVHALAAPEAPPEDRRPTILAAGGALTRATIETARASEVAWGGHLELELFAPFREGASPLVGMAAGLSFHPLEEGVRATMPVSVLFGFRTPLVLAYAGGTFGALFPGGNGSEGGYLFGALGAAGFDFGPARLLFQLRWEAGLLRAGQTQKTLCYGPLVSIGWDVSASAARPTPRTPSHAAAAGPSSRGGGRP